MWLRRNLWASLITQNARLTAEEKAWKELWEQFRADRERLRAERERLLAEIERERKRADAAVDELLATRGIGPVTPPPKSDAPEDPARMFEEDEGELESLRKRIETEGASVVMREDEEKRA